MNDQPAVTEGILSIQSYVAYGHVGNCAAAFPLQRLGFEVWQVPTVIFSNHTGYGAWRGHIHSPEQVRDLIEGVDERGALRRCRALLSGYLGDASLGAVVLDTLDRLRGYRPEALYVCDPVIGDDDRGIFVKPGIPAFFREQALPRATIITPNQFELGLLAERETESIESVLEACAILRDGGPEFVVVTSVNVPEKPAELAVIADCRDASWSITTPRVDIALNGTGDAFSSLLLGHYLRHEGAIDRALQAAVSAMFALVDVTKKCNARELLLVQAQMNYLEPSTMFEIVRLR